MSVTASVAGTRATVTISQATAAGLTMTLYRDTEIGRVPVPGVQAVVAQTMVVTDHAVPLNRPVTYVVVLSTGDVSTAAPVTLFRDLCLLTHPVSGDTADVWIQEWPDRTYDTPSTVVNIPGRRSPIVIADVENAPTSNPTLLTQTRDQRTALRALMATGELLLLRTVAVEVEDGYLAVKSRTERRFSGFRPDSPARVHALTVQEVGPEAVTDLGVGSTLADIAAKVPTNLSALAALFPGGTLVDIASTDWKAF